MEQYNFKARERAKNINYAYSLNQGNVVLDDHFTTDPSNKARDQEVTTTIYIPEGIVVKFDESTVGHIGRGNQER